MSVSPPTDPRLRVARVITRLNIGGPSIQALSLGPTLANRGFDTLLLHGTLGEAEGDMTTLLAVGEGEVERVPALQRELSVSKDLRALWQIYRALRRHRPHVVHTHMAKAGTVGRLAGVIYNATRGAAPRARLLHTYHGHVFEGYFGSITSRVFMAIERWIGHRSDAIVAISPQIQRDVVTTFGIADARRTHLVPLGFDLDRFFAVNVETRMRARQLLQLPSDALVVTTVGRLTPIKHHELFLDMAARLAPRHPRLVCLLVGDGESRQALERQVEIAGLRTHVRFLGWRGDLDVVYGATDVFVLTSKNEGTPVALIEAMASGVPAVSTDVGGVRDVLVDAQAGTLVPSGDAAALAEAVDHFVGSPERRRRAGDAARTCVRARYDLSRLADDLEHLYRSLVRAE